MITMSTALEMSRIEQARVRTHKLARPSWFPLAVFGLLVLLVSPLYTSGPPPWGLAGHSSAPLPWLPGVSMGSEPWFPSLTWIIGLLAAGVASFGYYHRRTLRVGVQSQILASLLAGAVAMVCLILASPGAATLTGWNWPYDLIVGRVPDLMFRGTAPLFVIAVVIGGLALQERSRALGAFAGGFIALVALVSLYNVENLFYRIHVEVAAPTINLILPGVALIGAALVSAVTREVP